MPGPSVLQIPQAVYEAILRQARAELPAECCGLLAGWRDESVARVVQHYPLVNELASATEFRSEPRCLFDAIRDLERRGLEVLAVYHSHPTSAPIPSRKDLTLNYSPDVVNLIISLQHQQPEMRGWWLRESSYEEAKWIVVGNQLCRLGTDPGKAGPKPPEITAPDRHPT